MKTLSKGSAGIAVLLARKNVIRLCGIVVVAVIIATLWPFSFCARNGVSWLPDGTGLRFAGNGVVVSKTPLNRAALGSGDSYSLEIVVRPAKMKSMGTFLSFYSDNTSSEFMLFRQGNSLEISRGFLNAREDSRSPAFGTASVFETGKLLLLTITSGKDGTTIFKNGGRFRVLSEFEIKASDLAGQIILGTSAIRFQPYSGEIRGLAVYNRELSPEEVLGDFRTWSSTGALDLGTTPGAVAVYRFHHASSDLSHSATGSAPDLYIPRHFVVPHKPFLESPRDEFRANREYAVDLVENVIGFMPVGFILCAYFAYCCPLWKAIVYATLAGGALSIAIEIAQFYVPPRGSGMSDIITNTAGAAIGALLLHGVRSRVTPVARQNARVAPSGFL